ncbi:hypothetical protein GCM10014713_54090 [Streptomyces purpureus]|uniref:Uncharacterized protein n=1 Tax=Streptomyces purpureus TaxID=1951 RepID=A0A918LUZ6_9ACTN|nr:hypothetical protein GCM10014713_54090 [Streptomyces purpureus]
MAAAAFVAAAAGGILGAVEDPGWSVAPANAATAPHDPGWSFAPDVTPDASVALKSDPGWSSVGA